MTDRLTLNTLGSDILGASRGVDRTGVDDRHSLCVCRFELRLPRIRRLRGPLPNSASEPDARGHIVDVLLHVGWDVIRLRSKIMAAVVTLPDVILSEEDFLRFLGGSVKLDPLHVWFEGEQSGSALIKVEIWIFRGPLPVCSRIAQSCLWRCRKRLANQ